MTVAPGLASIPRPKAQPIVGNALTIDGDAPIAHMMRLARELGPIFQLDIMGKELNIISGFEIVEELCDEARFDKSVRGPLHKVRDIAGDGLFTAFTSEPNWSKAHNILLPNFGDRSMAGYHPMMLDIAEQLVLKWARLNADETIDVGHDMTSVTLDTIAICGFGFRLNSFYRESHHPFIVAMSDALEIAMSIRGLPFEEIFSKTKLKRLDGDAQTMFAVVDKIIADRKAEFAASGDTTTKTDLLSYMLTGTDKKTGEKLDDTNIRYQIITFLIAGHETTSGLLAFTLYFLLKHPDVLARAREEVDRVFGTDISVKPTVKAVNKLAYVTQVLKEVLRLWPPAPAFAVLPYKDEVVGGKYLLKARSQNVLLLPSLHRDRSVWGENAERFDPDNFLPEREAARPVNAYKPFGNGQRACIGSQFAMQEAALVIGMIVQRFELIDPGHYEIKTKEAMSVKLIDFKLKVKPRVHASPKAANGVAHGTNGARTTVAPPVDAPVATLAKHGTPLLVLFGSNLGTSEDIARQIAENGTAQGFDVKLGYLDEYVGALPTTGIVTIVTASYNGGPPDNASKFYTWLGAGMACDALKGVRFSVFGAGNRNWASTYQFVPRFIDLKLAEFGAERIYERGEGDARDDLDAHFLAWKRPLWPALAATLGFELSDAPATQERPMYRLEFVNAPQPNPLAQAHGAETMRVIVNRELQTGQTRSTRHVEIGLPPGVSYRAGDHLGVIASNGEKLVERVLRRFAIEPNTYVKLEASGPQRIASLPLNATLSMRRLLMHYVELQNVATRKQIAMLAEHTACPKSKPELLALASDASDARRYLDEIKAKHISVLALLERFPACELPLTTYIDMLPMMTPRYYSISSSPLAAPDRCSVTVAVVREPALSGDGTYEGIASTYLAKRDTGLRINAFVKSSQSGFALPSDTTRPIIMVGPGTGLAPFRGFLQERSILRAGGATLGTAMLFFGCRNPDEDFLYRDELEKFAADGIVDLHVAFSRYNGTKTYVQQLIAQRADAIWHLLENDAHVFVCGDGSAMEPAVRATFTEMHRTKTGSTHDESERWLAELVARERYSLDVWASS